MSKWSKQEKGSEQGDQEEDKTSDADHYKKKGSMDQLETEKEGFDFTSYEPQLSEILQQHRNVPSEISPWILQSMDQPPKEEKQPIGSSDGASSTSQPGYQGNEAGLGSAGWGAADDGDDGEPPNRSRQSHILSQCEASTSFQVRKKQPGKKAKMLEESFEAYMKSCEESMTDLQLVPDESDKPRSLDPGQPVGNLSMDRHFPSPTEGGFEPLALDVDGVHQTPNEPLGSCLGAYSNEAGPLTSLNIPRNPPSSYDKNHQQAVAVNDALMEDIGLLDPSEPPGNMLVDSHFPTPAEGGYRSLDPAGNVLVDNHFPPPAEGGYWPLEPPDDETGLTGSETTVDPQQEALGAASLVSTPPSMAGQEGWLGGEDDETGLTGSETTVDPQQEALGAVSAQPLVSTLTSMAGQEQWLGGEGAYSGEPGSLTSLNTARNPPSSYDKNHQQAVAVNDELMAGVRLN